MISDKDAPIIALTFSANDYRLTMLQTPPAGLTPCGQRPSILAYRRLTGE